MPLFFVGYALVVWFLVAKWRRGPLALLVLAVGITGLLLLNAFHTWLGDISNGQIQLIVLRSVMYPYTGLVAGVGLYIAVLPHRKDDACHYCGYDLSGVMGEVERLICPECGRFHRQDGRGARPSGEDRASLRRDQFPPQ